MSSSTVPVSPRLDPREHEDAINRLAYRDQGAADYPAQVVHQNNVVAYIYTIVNADVNGAALAILLPATSPTASPTPANSAVLVNAFGMQIGGGKPLIIYDAAGTDYVQIASDADGGMVVTGSGANAGIMTLTKLVAATIGPNSTQQHTLPAVASDTVMLLNAAQTGTNKTLTNPTINSATLSGTFAGNIAFTGSVGMSGLLNLTNGQIEFPAVQNASTGANTFDDYEEGTWTPANGSTSYSVQSGAYIKIGRMVYIWGVLGITTLGAGSTTTISGLPFSGTDFNDTPIPLSTWANLALAPTFATLRASGTTLIASGVTAASATITTSFAIFGNSALVRFAGAYRTAA